MLALVFALTADAEASPAKMISKYLGVPFENPCTQLLGFNPKTCDNASPDPHRYWTVLNQAVSLEINADSLETSCPKGTSDCALLRSALAPYIGQVHDTTLNSSPSCKAAMQGLGATKNEHITVPAVVHHVLEERTSAVKSDMLAELEAEYSKQFPGVELTASMRTAFSKSFEETVSQKTDIALAVFSVQAPSYETMTQYDVFEPCLTAARNNGNNLATGLMGFVMLSATGGSVTTTDLRSVIDATMVAEGTAKALPAAAAAKLATKFERVVHRSLTADWTAMPGQAILLMARTQYAGTHAVSATVPSPEAL